MLLFQSQRRIKVLCAGLCLSLSALLCVLNGFGSSQKWASPATISRMGMIFLSEEDVEIQRITDKWVLEEAARLCEETSKSTSSSSARRAGAIAEKVETYAGDADTEEESHSESRKKQERRRTQLSEWVRELLVPAIEWVVEEGERALAVQTTKVRENETKMRLAKQRE